MRSKIHWTIVGLAFLAAPMLPALAEEAADSITGKVLFDGKAPVQKPATDGGADAHCKKEHAKNPILKENMAIVSKDGGLKNVFVQVKSGLPKDKKWEVPKKPVVINQEGCRYVPHVFGVMAGQDVEVVNSDATNHNIHGIPKENKEFNFSQSQKGMKKILDPKLNKPEAAFHINCDVHKWMNARCFVMEHPFFAVTDADGKYAIKGLPAGEYELEFWHEDLGTKKQKVKVEDGKATSAEDVKFEAKKKAAAKKDAAKDKEEK